MDGTVFGVFIFLAWLSALCIRYPVASLSLYVYSIYHTKASIRTYEGITKLPAGDE